MGRAWLGDDLHEAPAWEACRNRINMEKHGETASTWRNMQKLHQHEETWRNRINMEKYGET
ncbi:uncharacterized, partial [Tachysurus ichikawai]